MHETMAFDRAIARALEMVNTDETLIIVTADHGHTMSMSGYQTRGVDIRGTYNGPARRSVCHQGALHKRKLN